MQHSFFALHRHPEVSKLEFEDCVLRQTAPALLSKECDISQVMVDVCTERPPALPVEALPVDWDASIVISAASADGSPSTQINALLADCAVISGQWRVSLLEVADLSEAWTGTATPGHKLSFVMEPGSGIDPASFETWLRNDLFDAVRLEKREVGARAILPAPDAEVGRAVVSYWFSDTTSRDAAISGHLFDSVLGSTLINRDSLATFMSVEHRLSPNPNTWSMPSEPLLAARKTAEPDQ